MTDSRADRSADHASHDLFVIAAAADRGADDAARSAARQQADTCTECSALLADLRAIRTNLSALPRELAVSRDFRISPERAAQLRGGGWRRLVERFSRAPLRPMASALTTLGVAGLVITVALPTLLGGFGGSAASTAGPAELQAQGSTGAAHAPAASAAPGNDSGAGAPKAGQTAAPVTVDTQGPGQSAAASENRTAYGAFPTASAARELAGPSSPNLVENPPLSPVALAAWISLAFVVIGVGLLVVARLGARIRAG